MANSKRKCKYHGEPTRQYIVVNNMAFCTFEFACKWAFDNRLKGQEIKRKADDKIHAKKKREFKANDKPLRMKAAQMAFNAFIRARDAKLPCISCNRSTGAKINAGHYKSVGSAPALRFEELNCNLQCEHCNMFKSGNIENYRPALIEKIGLDKVEWLEGPHEPKKYTCEQLKQIELTYKQKVKEL